MASKYKDDKKRVSKVRDAFMIGIGVADIAVSRMKQEIRTLLRNNDIDTAQAREMASRLMADVESRKDEALSRLNRNVQGVDGLVWQFLSEKKAGASSPKGYARSVREKSSSKNSSAGKRTTAKTAARSSVRKRSAKKNAAKKASPRSRTSVKTGRKGSSKRTVRKNASKKTASRHNKR
ncbi:MAG: hypothetical protein ACLFSN_04410 [Candidatus Woesearchaeota archaeon]